MKKVAALVVLATLASACSTNDSTSKTTAADTTPAAATSTPPVDSSAPPVVTDAPTTAVAPTTEEPTTVPVLTDSFRGVTKDSITLGVTYVDLDAVKKFVDIDHGDYEASYTAVINDINANGGVLGRKIMPVFGKVDPINQTTSDESCVKLTEDAAVFAVVGFAQDDGVLCYVEDHSTLMIGGVHNAKRLAAAKAPWYTLEANADNQNANGIAALIADGVFDGSKVAVAVNPTDEALLNDVVVPALKAAGVSVVSSAVGEDTGGDAVATEANVKVIAEKFRSDGADTIVIAGSAFLPFASGLAKTDFRPRLVGTDFSSVQAFSTDQAQDRSLLKDAVAAGIEPFKFDDPAFQHCKTVIEAAVPGLQIVDGSKDSKLPGDFVSASKACRDINLFVAIATKAGADLTYDTFAAAADSLGQFHVPGADASLTYSADHRDGNPPIYLQRWDGATSQFIADADPVKAG